MKRNKPKMGTRLVPSIENLEGCYEWGGKWDPKNKICWREHEEGGCIAPYKGVEYCWGVYPFEQNIEDPDGNWMTIEKFYPECYGRIAGSDEEGTFFEPFGSDGRYGDNPWDMELETKEDGMDWARDEAFSKFAETRNGPCYNPRGKPVRCSEPNAVACPDPKMVADYFQKRHFREMRLTDRGTLFDYKPPNRYYDKPWIKKPYDQLQLDNFDPEAFFD